MIVTIEELEKHKINDWHRWRAYKKLHPGHTLSDDAHQLLSDDHHHLLRKHKNTKYH